MKHFPFVHRVWSRLPRRKNTGNRFTYVGSNAVIWPSEHGYNIYQTKFIGEAKTIGQAKLIAGSKIPPI